MSHVIPLLSHLMPNLKETLKMALVTLKNVPNFVGTLFELIPTDSERFGMFWRFLEKVTFLTPCDVTGVTFVTFT